MWTCRKSCCGACRDIGELAQVGGICFKVQQEKDRVHITLFEKVLKKDQKLIERAGYRLWSKVIFK